MIRLASLLLLFAYGFAQGQTSFKNVKIYEATGLSYQPCEPSIAISKTNPDVIVAGAVLKYVYRSEDGGRTWTNKKMRSRHGVYGDPCIVSDIDGRFHYFHLSDPTGLGWGSPWILDRIVSQTSKSDGKRWSRGSSIGLNRPKQQDKEWVTYDPVNDQLIATWTQFDKYGDESPTCESNIMRSFSKNGKRWSVPVQLTTLPGNCVDNSSTAEGATSDVDEFGNIYTAWSLDGKIIVVKSTVDRNTGEVTSISEEIVAIDSGALWDFEIPGLGRANGMPILKCDRSGGPNNGTLYINWCDQRNGKDDTDVWLVSSKDEGRSWSVPIRVNDDPKGRHQFFTWMDLDQGTGRLHFVFYDRRNHSTNLTDVYYARSADLTNSTFENIRISDTPFDPSSARFFGDYNNISVFNGVVRPIWTRFENDQQSIWTAIINE
ncbi:MAG: glycosyl hydrolase [Flavobacteriales bacterium]|nr:glycosyl hydrolase [Flavobacteriales bacterium]